MLREVRQVRQIEGESRRRWFTDEDMDLTVWLDDAGHIAGFQLCYDKKGLERALTWRRDEGFSHHRIDDGEGRPGRYKGTPILVADGVFNEAAVAERFHSASREIEKSISSNVNALLHTYR